MRSVNERLKRTMATWAIILWVAIIGNAMAASILYSLR